jgi:hypothetical protein
MLVFKQSFTILKARCFINNIGKVFLMKLPSTVTLGLLDLAKLGDVTQIEIIHRYLSKEDCSSHISWQKIHFNKTAQNKAGNKAGGPTMQMSLL